MVCRQTKITNFHMVIRIQKNVDRLQIPVNHSLLEDKEESNNRFPQSLTFYIFPISNGDNWKRLLLWSSWSSMSDLWNVLRVLWPPHWWSQAGPPRLPPPAPLRDLITFPSITARNPALVGPHTTLMPAPATLHGFSCPGRSELLHPY